MVGYVQLILAILVVLKVIKVLLIQLPMQELADSCPSLLELQKTFVQLGSTSRRVRPRVAVEARYMFRSTREIEDSSVYHKSIGQHYFERG